MSCNMLLLLPGCFESFFRILLFLDSATSPQLTPPRQHDPIRGECEYEAGVFFEMYGHIFVGTSLVFPILSRLCVA